MLYFDDHCENGFVLIYYIYIFVCGKIIINVCTSQVMFYEVLKEFTEYGKQKLNTNPNFHVNSSLEGLVLGGLAGGTYCDY